MVVNAHYRAFVAHVFAKLTSERYICIQTVVLEKLLDDRHVGIVPAGEAGAA